MSEPRLNISISYDHASGLFTAHLANGASFAFDRGSVSGKLENALTLFARAVVNSEGGKWRQPKASPSFEYSYDEADVKRFSKSGEAIAPPLDLSFEELQ